MNDNVRIDATQLNVSVIGEGGNLGLTQMARTEFALKGGRLNTDAIDNSAGVDTSDHEVNIKILLELMQQKGIIESFEHRNQLLETLQDEVAEACLDDNRAQGKILSMDVIRSKKDISPLLECVDYLSKTKILDRRTEMLSTNQQLNECFSSGIGIPRSDLAVILSYTKMFFYKQVITSKSLNDKHLNKLYEEYFPVKLSSKYSLQEFKHPLKKEIIGTMLVNRIINQAGVTLLPFILSIFNKNVVDIVTAYTVIDETFSLKKIRNMVEKEFKEKDINSVYSFLMKIESFIQEQMIWLLLYYEDKDLSFSMTSELKNSLGVFHNIVINQISGHEKKLFQSTFENIQALGASKALAKELTNLDFSKNSVQAITLSTRLNIELQEIIHLEREIDKVLHFSDLQIKLLSIDLSTSWQKKHRGSLLKRSTHLKDEFLSAVIKLNGSMEFSSCNLHELLHPYLSSIKDYQKEFDNFSTQESQELSAIAVLLEQIGELIRIISSSDN